MLKKLLAEKFGSVHQAAIRMDILPPQVYRWCWGKTTPTLASLRRIADGLGIPLSELVDLLEKNGKEQHD